MEPKLTLKVIDTIADTVEKEPTQLGFRLSDYVDCDALERLAANSESEWTVSFDIPEYTVTVTSDRSVSLEPTVS